MLTCIMYVCICMYVCMHAFHLLSYLLHYRKYWLREQNYLSVCMYWLIERNEFICFFRSVVTMQFQVVQAWKKCSYCPKRSQSATRLFTSTHLWFGSTLRQRYAARCSVAVAGPALSTRLVPMRQHCLYQLPARRLRWYPAALVLVFQLLVVLVDYLPGLL